MKTVDIKGKPYVEVNERIKYFRKNYKGWAMISEIVSNEGGVCVMKAVIFDENGVIKATGYAYEKENSTFINKTSYIENCETSAWGRALANLGIGIDAAVSSADETQNAINNQNNEAEIKDTGKGYKELLCTSCGQAIKRNASYTEDEIAELTKGRYGKEVCLKCAQKLEKENAGKAKS